MHELFYIMITVIIMILMQVDAAESLVVECSVEPQGSIIRPNQFRSLPNLRQITLRGCLTQVNNIHLKLGVYAAFIWV